jgi:FtsZ-binding cell division protein ZapB
LEIASDQYAKVETNISNAPIASNDMVEKLKLENNNLKDELIKSQKENLDLRAQITELQKENASLKAKQKKK